MRGIDGGGKRLGHQHHSRATAERPVIDAPVSGRS